MESKEDLKEEPKESKKEEPKEEPNETKEKEDKESFKHSQEKIKLPKRKYAIIHGYFGQNYSGNTKNPGVHTVEEELENALFQERFISPCNYGDLKKVNWMRALNKVLPKDIRVFRIIEVSDHFDSKDNNNNREYHYILPSFLLERKNEDNKEIKYEEFKPNYEYRLTEEDKNKLKEICKIFLGTKKYHNYTQKVGFSDMSSQRHIIEMSCDDIFDFQDFEAVKFKIIGQSFLYNQIRKMIGMIIDLMRNGKDFDYLKNSFLSNKYDIPKAPGEGLYLKNIDYSKYNDRKLNKKNNIFLTTDDEKEMEEFRKELLQKIKRTELEQKAFSSWLWKLDFKRDLICN